MNKQLLLRDYPKNWEILPLVRFARSGNTDFVDGPFGSDLKVSDYTKTGVRVLQLQNLGDGLFINKSKIYTSQKKALMLSRCLTYPGDIIIAKMAEPLARAALVPAYEDKYLIVADLIKLRIARDIDPYYLLCFINFSDFRKEAERLSTGTTRTRISLSTLKKISVPKPPIELQKKLGLILKTIDRTIAKTEALIEKYQQIKAGLMHDLFTRGIGADGKLRPPREVAPELYRESAIGWIPKEWKYFALGQVADLFVGFAFKSDWFQNDGISLLRGENVGYGHPDWKDKKCLSYERAKRYGEYLLHEGDVVIGMDRTFTKSGVKITVLRGLDCPSLLVQRVGKFVAIDCDSLYLRWLLLSTKYLRDLINQQKGMDIPHLSKTEILEPLIPIPHREEQQKIAQKIEMCNSNIQKEHKKLGKLKKQKFGLMQDLLTGKVTVNVDSNAP